MRSALSCLVVLLIAAAILLGAFWLYRQVEGGGLPWLAPEGGGDPRLTLHNQTATTLTVTLTGPGTERLQLPPGATATRSLPAGAYQVEARLADPGTEPFAGEWTFEPGGTYEGGFRSDGDGAVLMVLRPGSPQGAGAAQPSGE